MKDIFSSNESLSSQISNLSSIFEDIQETFDTPLCKLPDSLKSISTMVNQTIRFLSEKPSTSSHEFAHVSFKTLVGIIT